MFLQVIWNSNLKQTSLIVSSTESNEYYPVIISFILKEDISTNFVQNFIAFPDLELLYIEDKFLWLENYHITKNILAFFNVLELIELNENHLHDINLFIQKQKLSTNDFDNLGFQSPVKTVPRDLSTSPAFMKYFFNIADVSIRLLRTTFAFRENTFVITINKRHINAQHFFNHLNSDYDRLRIKQSLASPFADKSTLLSYTCSLDIFKEPINAEIIENIKDSEISLTEYTEEEITIDKKIDNSLIKNDIIIPNVATELKKEQIVNVQFHYFFNSVNLVEQFKTDNISKIEEVLENFVDQTNNNVNDFFSNETHSEEFLPDNSIEQYDNSVFLEQDNISKIDFSSVEEELTEEFLVEIENNLQKHTISLLENYNGNIEDKTEDDSILTSVSVDDLVDSINNIIEEPELELIDIIKLPIILFLSNSKPVILDSFIDNFFINSDVNEEINHFSAEEVLNVVKTEVSIFENTVSEKKKKQSKNKKDQLTIIEHTEPVLLDIIKENNTVNQSIINEKNYNVSINNITQENSEIENINNFSDKQLEKISSTNITIYQFLEKVQIIPTLLIHSVYTIEIIQFIVAVNIVETSLTIETVESSFDFFEENKKRLIELCISGELDLIDDLYRNYPEFEKPLINFNYEGDNPICIASFYEHIDLLKKLIEYGWDANYFDNNLNNALIIASAEGHKHIVRYLLTQNTQINFQNKIGYTALHFAVNDCNHRIVKLLLDAGADVEISDNDRNTALSIAAFKGDINSTKLLLKTRLNVHTKNKKGYDARSIALIAKNHAIAKLIEEKIISEKHNHSLPPIIEKKT